MKKLLTTIIILAVIVGLIAGIVLGSKNKATQIAGSSQDSPEPSTPTTSVADGSEVQVLYWGTTCPYCHDVIEWIEENHIDDSLAIVQKEVYNNQVNAAELSAKAESCGLNTSRIGVPFLYTSEGTCLIGAPDITQYLQLKASQSPAPAEAASAAATTEEGGLQ